MYFRSICKEVYNGCSKIGSLNIAEEHTSVAQGGENQINLISQVVVITTIQLGKLRLKENYFLQNDKALRTDLFLFFNHDFPPNFLNKF